MNPNFSIAVERSRALVRVTLNGFFSAADVSGFATEQMTAYAALGDRLGQHVTIVDVSDCKIQPQEVVEAFRALLADPRIMSRKLAFVTGRSPARMQIRRLISRDTACAFDDVTSAERWLFAPMAAGDAHVDIHRIAVA